MARILCLSFSPLHTDPRVRRQIEVLRAEHTVTAAGFSDPRAPGVTFVNVSGTRKNVQQRALAAARLLGRRFDAYYRNIGYIVAAESALRGNSYDLIVANDADAWPLALVLRGSARLLFDAHEYAPREFENLWWWRHLHGPFLHYVCAQCLGRADAVTTVCDGIADEYARVFNIRRPVVLMNTPPRRDAAPQAVPRDEIRMIHHGAAIRSRRIETMILALDHLDNRFSLDLMLVGNDTGYLSELRQLARTRPRVRFRPPVPMQQIPEETRDYELGVFLLAPTNFNYQHALPNKFFEFIQARLAVAIGPSPEMARLVRTHNCGLVADDFTPVALARSLCVLTPDMIARLKRGAHSAADALCWENESKKLRAIVRQLLDPASCAA